jgi:uncharacterized repeat protein (TIGR01451 family)
MRVAAAADATVTCAVGALAAGGSRMLLIQARTDAATADGLAVHQHRDRDQPHRSDAVTATADVIVRQPVNGVVDLVIDKQGATQVSAGELLTYTLVITNRGPGLASAVQIVDALPYEIIGLGVESSQGTCNNSVVCQLGDLAAGATATVTISGWARTETLSGTNVVNTARVSSNNLEVTPADNVDALTTTVDAHVFLTIDKTVQPPSWRRAGRSAIASWCITTGQAWRAV